MTVYVKTDAGREEIATRARKLVPAIRSVLLMVDGARDARQLRELGAGLHAPADALDQLLAAGLIEAAAAGASASKAAAPEAVRTSIAVSELGPAAQRYRLLGELMSEAVRQNIGLRGFMLQLKIERCANAEELTALLPELEAAIAKAKGETKARAWSEAMQATMSA